MKRINKLLRRLKPRQIAIVGAVTGLALIAATVFGLAPLAVTLLLPLGEAVAGVAGLIISIGGTLWIVLAVPGVFTTAIYDRLADDEMIRIFEEFAAKVREARG